MAQPAEQIEETIDQIADDHTPPEGEVMDQLVREVEALLEDVASATIEGITRDLHPADLADLFEKLSPDQIEELAHILRGIIPADTFTHLPQDIRQIIFRELNAREIARIVGDLDSDDALDLIAPFDEATRNDIILHLSRQMRAAVEEGLTFEAETAGRIMQREVVAIPQFWTVGKTLDYLRALQSNLPEEFYDIFVVDPMYHVVGEVPLSAILRAARTDKLHELARETTHTIAADTDQEDVAMRFRRDNLTSAPVVDDDGRLLGVVTVDDVVNVIDREAEEDVLKLAGLSRTDLYRAAFGTARSRFSWLFINLLTAILASAVISMFEASIDQIVALAVLMPIVASMGGNAGTQALTVAVRSLATNELSAVNAWRIIGKETLVGLLNGIAFAVITGAITWAWFADPLLGGVIAGAMIFNLIAAGLAGVGIPVLLNRIGIDPAVASTVFVTTITDVLGFFLFLGLAGIVLL